jgi:predicted RNA-binding Zn-ribbon protein involved in translation (DUF1610 family)/heme/copper-type cytochrome/quinol oxidase subunit 4
MKNNKKHKGTWTHRLLILIFSVALTILFYWLISFVMKDIGSIQGVTLNEVRQRVKDPNLLASLNDVNEKINQNRQLAQAQKQRQSLLKERVSSTQQTIDQLLEIQRLSLEKGITMPEIQQREFSTNLVMFLENQKRIQVINEDIADLEEKHRALLVEQKGIQKPLDRQDQTAVQQYNAERHKHNLKMAGIKLLVLVPLLGIALYFFLKKRSSIYAPLIYAGGAALIWKVGMVLHEHFPSRYFKYILIVVVIIVVLQILVHLLRMVANPKQELLLAQYREAYEKFLCPVCRYPIRRGPLKYLFWNSRTIKKLQLPPGADLEKETPYTCPACSTQLYEKCASCEEVRHTLLPTCEKCAAVKEI